MLDEYLILAILLKHLCLEFACVGLRCLMRIRLVQMYWLDSLGSDVVYWCTSWYRLCQMWCTDVLTVLVGTTWIRYGVPTCWLISLVPDDMKCAGYYQRNQPISFISIINPFSVVWNKNKNKKCYIFAICLIIILNLIFILPVYKSINVILSM